MTAVPGNGSYWFDSSPRCFTARRVVTFVSASVLVITPAGKGAGAMRFVVSPSTHREGNMTIGAMVSVRYRIEDQR